MEEKRAVQMDNLNRNVDSMANAGTSNPYEHQNRRGGDDAEADERAQDGNRWSCPICAACAAVFCCFTGAAAT